jgi:hypothetical protein
MLERTRRSRNGSNDKGEVLQQSQKVADCWQEVNGVQTVDPLLQEKGGRRTLEEAIGTIGTIRTGG